MRGAGKLAATGVFKRVETLGDGAPKHVGVDIVVIVAEHAAELTEFCEFHFWVFGVKGVTEFSRGFANPFQAPFDGVLGLWVGDELLRGDTLMYERTREMLSRMSRRRRLGSLEDMDFVSETRRGQRGI